MAQEYPAAVLTLTLCYALIFMNSAETTDPAFGNGYPFKWDQVPGGLDDFQKQDNRVIINPWDYLERMGMFKTLLNASAKYFDILGLDNAGNVLWGLPLQHGWQFETGRLADPSQNTTCGYATGDPLCVSVSSWWACMNYDLAIIPFLAAAEAGLFEKWQPQTEILAPDNFSADFCYSIAGCHSALPTPMAKWKSFFEHLILTKPVSDVEIQLAIDKLLHYMWDAHTASVVNSLPKFKNRLGFLSGPEGQFGQDWATAVYFIAATHFPADFKNTNNSQAFLPPRMLIKNDKAPNIPDFNAGQNNVLSKLRWLNSMNKITGGYLLRLWEKAMCTEKGREVGREILHNMNTSPNVPYLEIFRMLVALSVDPKCTIYN